MSQGKKFFIITMVLIFILFSAIRTEAALLPQKLSGKILLQVESNGEAWYVYPNDLQRFYLGRPADAFNIMRQLGLGVSEKDYKKFNGQAPAKLSGRILIRAESHGEAYYVYPDNRKMYYLGKPADAFEIMKKFGLGITNANLSKIPISTQSAKNAEALTGQNPAAGKYIFNYAPTISSAKTDGLKLAVCVMRWSYQVSLPTADYFKKFFSGANNYINEITLGNLYFKNIQLAYAPQNYNGSLPQLFNEEDKLAVEQCDEQIDFSNVDALIVFPSAVVGRGGASAEYMPALQTNEGAINSRVLIGHYDQKNGYINHLSNDEYGFSVLAHELAHTKLFSSVGHDNSLECGASAFQSDSCSVVNYGNPFSTMSNDNGHFSAWFKYLAGPWIKQTIAQQSGIYQLTDIETPHDSAQLLRVPSTKYPLCFEYRKPIGLDKQFTPSNMTKLGYSGGIPEEGCLFISICTDKNYSSSSSALQLQPGSNYLFDATPASHEDLVSGNLSPAEKSNFYDIRDACLTRAKVFSNDELGVKISWDKAPQNDSINVQIDLNNIHANAD